jgi:hypothetical protein
MQSEIAPPQDDGREPDLVIVDVLSQLNRALETCLDEIEALNRRIDQLEQERARPG